jgi:hypothetical protein
MFSITLLRLVFDTVAKALHQLRMSLSCWRQIARYQSSTTADQFRIAHVFPVEIQAESTKRLRETYSEAEVGGNVVPIPDPLKWERLLFVTYVDMNVLVVRDETGAPDILVRKSEVADTVTPTNEAAPKLEDVEVEENNEVFVSPPDDVITTEYEM